MNIKTLTIILVLIGIGSGVYAYWYFVPQNDLSLSENNISQTENTIITDDIAIEVDSENENGFTIKQIPIETDNTASTPPIPNIERPLVFDSSIPESAHENLSKKIEDLKKLVKNNPERVDYWLDLGVQWKIVGDYEGAKIAWEYAISLNPQDSTIFSNLGKLYHFQLKDFPSAEKNLLEAIKKGPNNIAHYVDLHELYKFSYKQDATLAVDTLLEGIEKNPGNTDLLVTLAAHYKEKEDVTSAKKYYEQARDEAQELGNTELVEMLNEEIANL